jgi:hypothetical protein
MGKYNDARVQAIHDIRIALKSEGKSFINVTVKQLIILKTYE